MIDDALTEDDLELFLALETASRACGVTLYLIGAGAIQMGGDQVWRTRLSRNTLDWDFAVRVDSWEQFDLMGDHLTSSEGGFVQGGQRHRFKHVNGRGVIDIVPFGDLEQPEGEIDWGDGFVMNTTGLEVVERNHYIQKLAGFDLHAATIPAILGLKLSLSSTVESAGRRTWMTSMRSSWKRTSEPTMARIRTCRRASPSRRRASCPPGR